ncbi:MAG: DnaJ domain-containing protein [Gammaproteobacteria bacterium]|nr:DnaJ domain-containing protein [Gammaproteobacteria bacterium]
MGRNIFNLARDFFQSPAEHRDLLDPSSPLPPDVSYLLDALTENKDPGSEEPMALAADLREAIQFMIERVFFAPGADCYRILGLNYGARPDEIRKHYNQLLHIYALDQADRSGEWNPIFATEISRAYSVLRDPERRRAYDQHLIQRSGVKGAPAVPRDRMDVPSEAGKAPGNVSYLNPGPSVRPMPSEDEIKELQRQVQQSSATGARERTASAEPAAPQGSSRSSFIANRIDRANGLSETGGTPEPELAQVSSNPAPISWSLISEPVAGAAGKFPKGIPVTPPEPAGADSKRILSMDRSTFAILVAVIMVLGVYAIVLPNRLGEDSGSGPASIPGEEMEAASGDADAGSIPAPVNGNVVRDTAEQAASSEVFSPFAAIPDPSAADAGEDKKPAVSRATSSDARRETGSAGNEPVNRSAPNTAASRAEARQPAVIPPGGQGAGGENRSAQSSPARPAAGGSVVRSEPAVAASAKPPVESPAVTERAAPSRKLESLRQTLLEDKPAAKVGAVANAGVVTVPRDDAAAKIPAQATIAPSAPAVPRVDGGQMDKPALIASVAPVQASRNGEAITIQELDRLAETFSRAYEAGELDTLVGLFSEDARTNDQSSKSGIAADYRELFQISETRKFTISRLRWEQDKRGDGLKGEGDFQVDVKLKSDQSVTTVQGKVLFHVRRGPDGILITEMMHTYN